ncbi:MAG: hypothetical protein ACK5V3_15360 [Bdellovibrionales bacterium]
MNRKSFFHYLALVFLLVSLDSGVAQAQVMGFYHAQKNLTSDEALPNTSRLDLEEKGIDFKEWDYELEKSIQKVEKKCKGKNCNFKSRQALDSSFDF